MGAFQRSPSKVWWGDEYHLSPSFSRSSGSQDSGFSDNDSPPLNQLDQHENSAKHCIPKDILKGVSEDDSIKALNLSINFKPKSSPSKSLNFQLENRNASFETPRTPSRHNVLSKSDPIKRHRFQRNSSLKVNRSLFKHKTSYQYARDINDDVESQLPYGNSKVITDDSYILKSKDSSVELVDVNNTRSLGSDLSLVLVQSKSVPVNLQLIDDKLQPVLSLKHDDSFNSSECESELENAFRGVLEHPKHTSTPKASGTPPHMRHRRNNKRRSKEKDDHDRLPQMNFNEETEVVQKWLEEVHELYEPECMTTLQSKSIAAELAQNVACLATRMTSTLRRIISDAEVITTEFANIKGQQQHIPPLAQSLARLVEEFLYNFGGTAEKSVLKLCSQIKYSNSNEIINLLTKLNDTWEKTRTDILYAEIKSLIEELEAPHSELHVRAALTGLTSIALRNKEVVEIFTMVNAIQGLCVLGEKCESSTVRSLVLRSLSTICCVNTAIRQLETASGIQLIAETISEESRPEPERSEAVALLAQITAPWIEDNNCVRGLHEYIRPLVISLTNFIVSTKCCQNFLLCTAALANLTEMEPKSIKYIIHQNSVGAILNSLKSRGSLVSVYLLEQVATLIANLSTKPEARQFLTEENAAVSLLQFLHCSHTDEDVQQRLQQKSVIALSRLSCNIQAAKQIVQFDGVSKLVLLCRERKERHNSDAVLVAALATLRKIAEACGHSVIDAHDLQELVKPRLLDSFLTYSTQNESYV